MPHGSASTKESRAAVPPNERRPFVVAFVVDQHAGWIAEERWPLLPETGGFARLRREGTWAKKLRFAYAVTDTAPGHAALHTGKVPAETGIWGNELPDASGPFNGRITFLRDEKVRVVAPDGVRQDVFGSSPARLRADTVADRLRAFDPSALVVSISLKDRGAIMPAGKKPTHAIWFESHLGTFVTSTAFESTFPAWAAPLADARAITKLRGATWTLSDPDWIQKNAMVVDAAPGEGDLEGYGTTFPHAIKGAQSFRASPSADALLFDLALAALDAEYDPRRPTLLLMSMSSLDVIGHVFGPDSWEAWDHLYKLDASLGRFLDALEKRVGTSDFGVVLSADHGSGPMPETVATRREKTSRCKVAASPPSFDAIGRPICHDGQRLEPTEIQKELKAESVKALGPGDWILGVSDPYVFLGPAGKAAGAEARKKLDAVVLQTLRNKGVTEAYDVRVLEKKCPSVLERAAPIPDRAWASEDHETLVCRSWAPNVGAGDWYMVASSGAFFDGELTPGKGGSHGSPALHDRTVPFLMRGKDVDAGLVVDGPTDFTAYSAVLAAMLGLPQVATEPAKSPREIVQRLSRPAPRETR